MSLLHRIAVGKPGDRKDEATAVMKDIDQAKINLWNRRLRIEAWLKRRKKKYSTPKKSQLKEKKGSHQ